MTSQAVDDRLGKAAYDAYMIQLGDMSKPWDGLSGTEQNAWIAAARTIEAQVREHEL
ncbi:MAG TPA: hypothetical protein VFB50_12600 [Chloroflexota bacterium]|nr:hypothetical protein [Chloroflexota bacterium]